jgi:Ecdysteroid kinase-like family
MTGSIDAILLREPADLTPAVLTTLLEERRPGVEVARVTSSPVHQGSASHLRLDVEYSPGKDADLPARLFLKTQLATVFDLPSAYMVDMLSKAATATLLATETRLFREARELIHVEAPAVYCAVLLPDPTQFVIVLENLADRGARFPNPIEPRTAEEVDATLATLARHHAEYWASPMLDDARLSWLRARPRRASVLQGAPSTTAAEPAPRNPFQPILDTLREPGKAAALALAGIDARQLGEAVGRQALLETHGPPTWCHGDSHIGNIFHLPDGTAGLLDWQLSRQGCWAHDVTYAMCTALDSADRRAHERDLLGSYLDGLRAHGAPNPPSFDEAWHLHRCFPMWGFPAWSITPQVMYDPGAVVAVMERIAVAIAELRSLDALGM